MKSVNPILRWAGGKRRLAPKLRLLMPSVWNRYIEPMAGSAALFFYVAPDQAILADLNPDLINFYVVLRDDCAHLIGRLSHMRASRKSYYQMRELKPRSKLDRAVRFAYLNRLSWNGLYRVNKEGKFNSLLKLRMKTSLNQSTRH